MSIHRCSLPPDAFLQRYAGNVGYADCFRVDVRGTVGLGRYVEAAGLLTSAIPANAEMVCLASVMSSASSVWAK